MYALNNLLDNLLTILFNINFIPVPLDNNGSKTHGKLDKLALLAEKSKFNCFICSFTFASVTFVQGSFIFVIILKTTGIVTSVSEFGLKLMLKDLIKLALETLNLGSLFNIKSVPHLIVIKLPI